jgi:large subunit ribosomal protein L35
MPKNKTHKGLLKRIKITKSGLVKVGHAGQRHLKSAKSSDRIRSYRRSKYAKSPDMPRLKLLLQRQVRSAEDSEREKDAKAEKKPKRNRTRKQRAVAAAAA